MRKERSLPVRRMAIAKYHMAIFSVRVCAAREMDPGRFLMELLSELP